MNPQHDGWRLRLGRDVQIEQQRVLADLAIFDIARDAHLGTAHLRDEHRYQVDCSRAKARSHLIGSLLL
jgi:hypothetical protein